MAINDKPEENENAGGGCPPPPAGIPEVSEVLRLGFELETKIRELYSLNPRFARRATERIMDSMYLLQAFSGRVVGREVM